MLKARNSLVPTRRSQAAVLAVMPDQGSGEGSENSTLTVWPIWKESSAPTGRQRGFAGLTRGPRMKPITGKPARIAMALPARIVMRAKKRRRESSTFSQDGLIGGFSVVIHVLL